MEDHLEFSKELAIKSMRAGVIAGMVLFGIMLGKVIVAFLSDQSGASFSEITDPWVLFDLGLIFLLIWGITRYSRFAAIALFLLYLTDRVIQFLDTGSLAIVAIGLVMLFFFARAIKGTLDYHQIMREADPNYRSTRRWMWWVGTPLALIVVFLITLGTLQHYEVIPASYVKSKQDITSKDLVALQSAGLIDDETEVLAFYSDGLFSRTDSGVFMTAEELVVYATFEDGLYYDSMRYEEIDWVKQISQGGDLEDSTYQVSGRERYRGFQFSLSVENNGHEVFIHRLKNKISAPMPKIEIPLPPIDIGG